MTNDYRQPTSYEVTLLERLLAVNIAGRGALLEHARGTLVRTIDSYGSFEFELRASDRSNTTPRALIEAQTTDLDGVPIDIILFTVNGKLDDLEISKADGTAIARPPVPSSLDVWTSSTE
jgi:hypothetical protein